MSSLIVRGKNNYVYLVYKKHGKTHSIALGIKLDRIVRKHGKIIFPEEVRDFQRRFDLKLKAQEFGLPDDLQKITISELLELYLRKKQGEIGTATVYEYKLAVDKLKSCAGDVVVSSFTEEDAEIFRSQLLETLKRDTVGKTIRQLSALFSYAVKKRYALSNPFAELHLKPSSRVGIRWKDTELIAFFTATRQQNLPLFQQLMFLFLTGFRSNESCQLTWDMVNFEDRVIVHENQKGRRDNLYPMDTILEHFMRSLTRQYDPFVFRYRNRSRLRDAFVRIAHAVGLRKELTPHTLKKSYAKAIALSGASVAVGKELSHHTDYRTTLDHYVWIELEERRAALEKARGRVALVLHQCGLFNKSSEERKVG